MKLVKITNANNLNSPDDIEYFIEKTLKDEYNVSHISNKLLSRATRMMENYNYVKLWLHDKEAVAIEEPTIWLCLLKNNKIVRIYHVNDVMKIKNDIVYIKVFFRGQVIDQGEYSDFFNS